METLRKYLTNMPCKYLLIGGVLASFLLKCIIALTIG